MIIDFNPSDTPAPPFTVGAPETIASASGLAEGSYRILHQSSRSDVAFGIWRPNGAAEAKVRATGHLFVLVLAGGVRIDGARLGKGQSLVLPCGAECVLEHEPATELAFSTCRDEAYQGPRVPLLIDMEAELAVLPPMSADILVGPQPRQSSRLAFADTSGLWKVGVWESEPYQRRALSYLKDELMYFHEGSTMMQVDGEAPHHAGAHSPFLVPKGTPADWKSEQLVKKVYCSYG